MNETRRSGWIQIVGTAVLTCLLTVVAGVAVWYFTRQDAALRYTVVKTEPFFGASAATLIYKVEVTDPGNKEVELFTCDIAFPGAKITFEPNPRRQGMPLSSDCSWSSH